MGMKPVTLGFVLVVTTALSACGTMGPVGPDYTAPKFDLVGAYTPDVPVIATSQVDHGRWWESTRDPVLRDLIQTGIGNNIDLQIAASRIAEARAAARGIAAENGVEIRGTVDGSAERGTSSRTDGDQTSDLGGHAGIDLSWTPDIWGGQQRENEEAIADYLQQLYLREDVYLTVIADITRNYIELRGTQRRQELLENSLNLQRQTADLVRVRLQTGLSSELDMSRALAEVADIQSTLPTLQTAIDRSINAIAILLGAQPGQYRDNLDTVQPLPEFDSAPPIGIPADLLRRRPDVRAAELALISATAEIGVQTADLYPEFTLDGSIALGATGYGSGPIIRTVLAAIGGLIDATIYDGGARQADIDVASQRAQQAFLTYRQTLLNAIGDVESAIYGYVGAVQQRDSLELSVEYHRNAFEQSRVRYVQGLSNFIDVLDSQRTLTQSQQDLADAETDLEVETINLYAAVGLDIDAVERVAAQNGMAINGGGS